MTNLERDRAIAMAKAMHRARDIPITLVHEGTIKEAAELSHMLDAYFAHTLFYEDQGWGGGSIHRFEPEAASKKETKEVK